MLQLLRTALTWLAPLAFVMGLAHLGYQAVKHWDVVTLDLRFFWLAGEFWREGLSPYNTDFATAAAEQFNITKGAIWYYTPNWFFISVLLSELSPLAASRVVLFVNALLLLGASILNVAAYRSLLKTSALIDRKAAFTKLLASLPLWAVFGLHAGFMALSQAAGNSLHLGQSSILIYFGASMLVFALPSKTQTDSFCWLCGFAFKTPDRITCRARFIAFSIRAARIDTGRGRHFPSIRARTRHFLNT